MEAKDSILKLKIVPHGPLLVEGTIDLTLADGTEVVKENPHFCRCGSSKHEPFCDGTHAKINFQG